MFGYVRPLKAELKVKTFEQYQAAYCGLCRTLGRQFGFAARFTVSYDLVFLYLLLDGMRPAAEKTACRCPAKPWKKRACVCQSPALEQAAAVNVILSYWKLEDAARDERGLRRFGARLGGLFLRHAYRRAERACPAMAELTQRQLRLLAVLETEAAPNLDRYADAFCQILCGMAEFFPQPELSRPARELLYHVGRYLYLTDALDDLEKDLKKGGFNPLALRFQTQNGALSGQDRQYLLQTIDQSLDLAAAALELLPLKGSDEILHNIVYLGLPAVLKSVADGSFHKRKKTIGRLQTD